MFGPNHMVSGSGRVVPLQPVMRVFVVAVSDVGVRGILRNDAVLVGGFGLGIGVMLFASGAVWSLCGDIRSGAEHDGTDRG